ncbi:MAG: 1-deoxy-D-xylulose-5-phosphate reductoisomerase [Alphaproteobacteria bacterium]|nr:1-deoxy-D-xylulose-5-phosphate reductoisomerase [Alphaproteobacteria bacterium]
MTQQFVTILGSTGSIGTSTLDLIRAHGEKFKIRALIAGSNVELLIEQALAFKPEMVAIHDETRFDRLREGLKGSGVEIVAGRSGVLEAAALNTDICVAAIVGLAGLEPLMTALPHCRKLLIANKEPLVAAGPIVMRAAYQCDTKIIPLDSEHNAIFQVFEDDNRDQIDKLILTASGGPFRTWPIEKMNLATPDQAIAHPNWSMGKKISVDSASMVNKALEIIEANQLFGLSPTQIEVIIHPQSIIHSMVEYRDGSVLAQMGAPDMRTPIAYALAYPNRMETTGKTINWATLKQLDFEEPDHIKFPALRIAYSCIALGGAACIALNAANEAAVEHYLNGKIAFGRIIPWIEEAINLAIDQPAPATIPDVIELDQMIRHHLVA